jgi:transcriptional regulator with XRE-family HTH domain
MSRVFEMATIDGLLDTAKEAVKASNDTELAKALGIRPAAVSNYRRGVSLPNAVVCATLAGLTGEPLAKVIGIVGEARAISSDEKAVWRKLAATVMGLMLFIGAALPESAKASAIQGFTKTHAIHYAKSATGTGALDVDVDQCRFLWFVSFLVGSCSWLISKVFSFHHGHDPKLAHGCCSPQRILGDPGGDSGKSTQMLLSSCERTQTFAVHDERHAEKAGTFTQFTALYQCSVIRWNCTCRVYAWLARPAARGWTAWRGCVR